MDPISAGGLPLTGTLETPGLVTHGGSDQNSQGIRGPRVHPRSEDPCQIMVSVVGPGWADGTHSIQISIDLVATTDQKSLISAAVVSSGDELLIIAFKAAVLSTNNRTALPESISCF